MGLRSPDQIILFDLMFVFILGLYGFAITPTQLSNFASIPTPALAPLPPAIHCAFYDYICNSTSGIVQATAYIGWAIVNAPVLFIYFIIVVITFGDLVIGLMFSPRFSTNGIPLIGFFFTVLQVFVIYDVLKGLFRGSSTGL